MCVDEPEVFLMTAGDNIAHCKCPLAGREDFEGLWPELDDRPAWWPDQQLSNCSRKPVRFASHTHATIQPTCNASPVHRLPCVCRGVTV